IWHGGKRNEEKLLTDCYKNSLDLAKEHGLKSVAFPLISSGIFGYPKDEAIKVAISTIKDFLMENEMTVFIVTHGKPIFELAKELLSSIK
ncbi:MAG TPA: macro domain-containing protein, partial [Clostridia bacterium]|nr:macro domain-containing protein [Clostridia bacterium]